MIEYVARGSSTAEPTERAQWLSGLGTGTSFNPELGMHQPGDWPDRPKRRNPDLFGVNTQAQALADSYNTLQGYGLEEVETNTDHGWAEHDTRVRVDPWSGRIIQSRNPGGVFNITNPGPTYTSIADLAPTPVVDFAKARELVAELRGLPGGLRAQRLADKDVQETLSPFVFAFDGDEAKVTHANIGSDYILNQIDKAEADYNTKADAFNQAKSGYDAAWSQVKDQYLSPTLDKQLRELMPDDGKSYDNAFTTNYENFINTVNYTLRGRTGIDNLQDLASTTHDGREIIYNRRTGQEVDPNIVNFRGGKHDGNVTFRLKATENGGVTFDTKFKKPSKWGGGNWINVVAPLAFGIFAGGALGGALTKAFSGGAATAGLGATIAGKGLAGGITSAALGGDFKRGLLGGVVGVGTGAAGSLVGKTIGDGIAGKVIGGAVSGGLSSALMGGDIQTGLLGGAVSGAVSKPAPKQASTTPTASRFQISNKIFGGKT